MVSVSGSASEPERAARHPALTKAHRLVSPGQGGLDALDQRQTHIVGPARQPLLHDQAAEIPAYGRRSAVPVQRVQGSCLGRDIANADVEVEDATCIPALVIRAHIHLRPGLVQLHQPNLAHAAIRMTEPPFPARRSRQTPAAQQARIHLTLVLQYPAADVPPAGEVRFRGTNDDHGFVKAANFEFPLHFAATHDHTMLPVRAHVDSPQPLPATSTKALESFS